jgi:serine/threonine protein kinase
MAADSHRVKELFAAALDLTDEPARQAFLDRECAGDAGLRRRLEELLHAHDQPQPALDRPLAAATPALREDTAPYAGSPSDPAAGQAGAVLAGKYRLLEKVGEGGMGAVWMAQQTEPVKRTVAVKLIKAGADSKAVLARFEAERQALALMDHPNIAKVLDAGATASGRPFFVMELVKGVPITKYCDEHRLTPRQRLELFVPVCQALQHAHQKGVIHRDVKPANVLVTLYDGRPVPKVIDFGVAKATGQELTGQTQVTGFGALVGTPQYMSPEQATLNNLDIDTRSDIYSLGVLLYELLTSSLPFRRKDLERAGMLEVLRVIREEEPPKPSDRLSTAETLPSLAANRSTEPARLTRLLRGEIDWIVMKAMEKERGRRYETASGFARDIERYLADEPVLAGPPGAGYRLKKFLKRHKGRVAAAALVLLALLAGMAGTTVGLLRAEAARQAEADRAEGERRAKLEAQQAAAAAQQANAEARRRLQQIEKGTEILVSVFHDLDPREEEKEGASLRVLLGRRLGEAVRQLEGEAVGDPAVVARLQMRLGKALLELGHYGQAEVVLTKARRTLEASLGADHPRTLTAKHNLAALYEAQAKYPEAEALYQEALAGRTARLGADHPDTLTTRHNLAFLYLAQGQHARAEALFREVLAAQIARLGADHPDTLDTKNDLAALYDAQGQYARAETLLQEVLAGRTARLGADHPDTLRAKNNLAAVYQSQGKYAQAQRLFEEALAGQTAQLGADHPSTLSAKGNLASLYQLQQKYARAATLYREVLAVQIARLGADHPETLNTKNSLAALYRSQRKYTQAERLFGEALAGQTAKLGADHASTLATKNNLAVLYELRGQYARAEALFQEVLAARTARLGADHPSTLTTKSNLAELYWRTRKLERSVPLFEEVVELKKKKLGAAHPDTLAALTNLGVNYRDAGRLDDGIRCLEEALAATRASPGTLPADLDWMADELALAYDRAKRFAKSEPLYRESLQHAREQFGAADPRTAGRMAQLAQNLLAQKKHAEAEAVLRDCLAVRQKQQPDDWATFNARSLLGEALLGQQKYAEAEPLLQEGYRGLKQRRAQIPAAVRQARLAEALRRLVRLYEATGNQQEAARWRKEREAAKSALGGASK